jgi:DNA (cytosine-5)-methyltransferase 1
MKVAGLFAGIGGIELGLDRAGFETALLCEIEEQACAVLDRHFQGVPIERDVRKLVRLPKSVDLVTAGFPCQDLSQAGETRGIAGRRSGLVGEVFRLLEGRRPPWVLIENVPFLLSLQRGRGMRRIVSELERLGYRWAYRVIDTQSFGLPQRRERVFILASRDGEPERHLLADEVEAPVVRAKRGVAHGFYWTEGNKGLGWAVSAVPTLKGGSALGIPSPPAIWFADGNFATPNIRDAERLQGFPVDWTKPAEAVGRASLRWSLVGNSVSVPVSNWIGKRLLVKPAATLDWPMWELARYAPWPKAAFGGPGRTATAVDVGASPVMRRQQHLHDFMRFDPKPLSHRAASGFWSRLSQSTLKRPAAFDHDLVSYIQRVA